MSTRFLRLFLSTLVLVLISSGIQAGTYHSGDKKKEKKEKLSGDGPYILYQADGSTRVINVNKKGRITDKTYATLPKDFSFRVTDHEGRYPFDVKLHPLKRPEWQYTRPEKVFVMSDPHGRLDCVISLLQGNGVINDNYQWNFGSNHLVIIGDIFDRGKDVLQIFWLFYKLEDEAAKTGGHVSFLLGNQRLWCCPTIFAIQKININCWQKNWEWNIPHYSAQIPNWAVGLQHVIQCKSLEPIYMYMPD